MGTPSKQVRVYQCSDGRVPFVDWLGGLTDQRARQKIQARIGRVRLGNFGNTRSVGEGIQELKVDYGPGYRVYFGRDGESLVILLCGGDKRTQVEDIKVAKQFWAMYKQEKQSADS